MKKSDIAVFVLNFVLLISILVTLILKVPNITYIFVVSDFALIGIYLIVRSLIYKIDSNLFLGMTTGLISILASLFFFTTIDKGILWPFFILILAFAAFIVGMYFKDKFQIGLFFDFVGIFVVCLLVALSLINAWWLLLLIPIWIVLSVFIKKTFLVKR
ncbi:MAG: hypothetical protein PHP83_02680 [Clostridia bacterium]|nr:hypothetical protein [Clostridia bacterium]